MRHLSKINRFNIVFIIAVFILPMVSQAEDYSLESPDKTIQLKIQIDENIKFSVQKNSQQVIFPSQISLKIKDGKTFGKNPRIKTIKRLKVNQIITPVIKEKFDKIRDCYNELRLVFDENYMLTFRLTFRAYDDGIAYRWETAFPDSIVIENEEAQFQFSDRDRIYLTKDTTFQSNYEKPYINKAIPELSSDDFGGLPALIRTEKGINVLIAESDLDDYPGLWLRGNGDATISAVFPGYPSEETENGRVKTYEDFIAKTRGARTFPWRIMAIAEHDADLLTNQLVYLLAKPLQIDDASWIKPGWIILDWWARRNIFDVDFEAGINTETMKYFIDFCANYGIRYYLLDEGWSTRQDILKINPNVDLQEVLAYSKEKDVDIVLWVYWKGLDAQLEKALDQFEEWGVKGIKVDFMDRDDQKMVNFFHRVAREAAKRKLVIDFHGCYKPAGLRRAYPNVLTREGFMEFEYNGGSKHVSPEYLTMLPFIRMVCGPVDYIPGTLNNAQKKNHRPVGDRPMGQGTRANAFALAVVLESQLQMIPDSPSDYYKEDECTRFLTQIPVEWDETTILDAKFSDYIVIARRNGATWYVAAITDWDAREKTIDFSFLDEGDYQAEIMQDGPNAHRRAIDYQMHLKRITPATRLPIKLAPGGGWVAKITKIK